MAGGVVNTNPSHMSIDIEPNILFTRISKSELALLRSDAEVGRKINEKLTRKQFNCSRLGRRFLGIAMMHVPKLALESAERFIVLVICWFLADLGFNSLLSEIANVTPSASTLREIMVEEAIDTIVIEEKICEEFH